MHLTTSLSLAHNQSLSRSREILTIACPSPRTVNSIYKYCFTPVLLLTKKKTGYSGKRRKKMIRTADGVLWYEPDKLILKWEQWSLGEDSRHRKREKVTRRQKKNSEVRKRHDSTGPVQPYSKALSSSLMSFSCYGSIRRELALYQKLTQCSCIVVCFRPLQCWSGQWQ